MQKLKNIIIKEEKRCEAWWKWKKENHKLPENCELSIGRLKPCPATRCYYFEKEYYEASAKQILTFVHKFQH